MSVVSTFSGHGIGQGLRGGGGIYKFQRKDKMHFRDP